MSSSHRVGRFVGDLRAGNPRVTFFSQSAPLLFLVPTGLWLAHGQGNLLWSAIGWAIGGSAFNALWFPYLRRNEHPPHGSSQSVAAATCAAAVFFTPQLWLLLSAFIAMGVALGLLSGSRRHPLFQTVCAYPCDLLCCSGRNLGRPRLGHRGPLHHSVGSRGRVLCDRRAGAGKESTLLGSAK